MSFIDDQEKMIDFLTLTKEEFLESYSYLTEEEYEATKSDLINMYGYKEKHSAEERLLDAGYENVKYLTNYSYDDALIGVSEDGRAIYDFEKMVDWLIEEADMSDDEAVEWIEYNTIRALPYMGSDAPIIMYPLAYM